MKTGIPNIAEPESALTSLALSTKRLLAVVGFFEAEVMILRNALKRCRDTGLSTGERVQHFSEKMRRFEKDKIQSLNNLFCHQSNLKATIDKLMYLNVAYLSAEHHDAEEGVQRLQKLFEEIKHDFLDLSRNELKASISPNREFGA